MWLEFLKGCIYSGITLLVWEMWRRYAKRIQK